MMRVQDIKKVKERIFSDSLMKALVLLQELNPVIDYVYRSDLDTNSIEFTMGEDRYLLVV